MQSTRDDRRSAGDSDEVFRRSAALKANRQAVEARDGDLVLKAALGSWPVTPPPPRAV